MCENDPRWKQKPGEGVEGEAHPITWSEYEGMLWCFKCQIDTKGFGGIFDGPIPMGVTEMIIGPLCFHRYYMEKKAVYRPHMSKKRAARCIINVTAKLRDYFHKELGMDSEEENVVYVAHPVEAR